MPERHVRVGSGIDTARIGDVADVEQQAVAAACTPGESYLGIRRDVVTLRRAGALTRSSGGIDGAPLTARALSGCSCRGLAATRRRLEIIEDARRADDRGLLRRGERHADHLDAE